METPLFLYEPQTSPAEKLTAAIADERARQCVALCAINSTDEFSSEIALRLASTREGAAQQDSSLFLSCILGECGIVLSLANDAAEIYPIGCPKFTENTVL
jgi:hypothetical protein